MFYKSVSTTTIRTVIFQNNVFGDFPVFWTIETRCISLHIFFEYETDTFQRSVFEKSKNQGARRQIQNVDNLTDVSIQ